MPFLLADLRAAVLLGGKVREARVFLLRGAHFFPCFLAVEAQPGSQCSGPGTSFRRGVWDRSSAVADEHRQYFSAVHHATHCCAYGGLLPQWHWCCLGQVLCPTCVVWIAPTLRFLLVSRELSAASLLVTLQQQQNPTTKKILDFTNYFCT